MFGTRMIRSGIKLVHGSRHGRGKSPEHVNCSSNWETLQVTNAKKCDPTVSRRLTDAMESVTGSTLQLPSGAGHDAAVLSRLFPVAMLLVRCRHGLSHHPDEFVALENISAALQVTVEFLSSWG